MTSTRAAILATLIALAPGALQAQDGITKKQVHFATGASSATIDGTISGYDAIDYVLGASAGQVMTVSMETDNTANYFNVIAPGEDVAMFAGSTSGGEFEGTLPANGDYTVRVYLMRSAARRGETANYRIRFGIGAPAADFADGMAGGPDFWAVSVDANDSLNVRSAAGAENTVLGALRDGTVVRNLGCSASTGSRWCRVRSADSRALEGWVAGRYLVESAGPAASGSGQVISSSTDTAPGLYLRPSGEVEASWKGGCTILYDAAGKLVTAGSSCNEGQRTSSTDAVREYLKNH